MKEIKAYIIGNHIPSNGTFLCIDTIDVSVTASVPGTDISNSRIEQQKIYLYEIPIKEEKGPSSVTMETEGIINMIILHLNLKAGKNFSKKTKKTRDSVRARINEGFTFDDFTVVINKKCAEWLEDPRMNTYIRPETLFGSKFESYLNQTTEAEMNDNVFKELDEYISKDK